MGPNEYDARIRSQIHLAGDRTFPRGVSHISQMTGMEHRVLERSHLPIVANAPGLSQLPTQSDRTLKAYEDAYNTFMTCRHAWIDNKTRRGKNGVIPHFHIPKMHVIRHLTPHIRRKGSADNFSTETMEHLHIDVKDAYRASNRRDWKVQTTQWLTRRERVRDFEAWMEWMARKNPTKTLLHSTGTRASPARARRLRLRMAATI